MDNSIGETSVRKIAPQPFYLLILLQIICMIISFAYYLDHGISKHWLYVCGLTITIILLIAFKKYLRNFNSSKAVYLMNWNIVATALVIIFSVINTMYKERLHNDNLAHIHLVRNALYAVLYYSVHFFDVYIHILLGIELLRISDDFIGLVKPVGKMLAYVYPGPMVLFILINLYNPLSNILYSSSYLWLVLLMVAFFNISNGMLIVAFYRAQRYLSTESKNNPHES